MASTTGVALIDLQARVDKLQADIKRALSNAADDAAKTLTQKLEAVGTKLQSVGKKMTLGVTAPIAALGVASFAAASDLNESMSKVDVVFGDSANSIKEWSKASADAFGQSQQQALEAAGTYGNLFKAMGIATGPAADMSKSLVQLAGDLASFNNANPEDVLLALRSGLVGETEPLRQFGVNLNQARIEAEALRLGLVKGNADMTKVQAATIAVAKAQQAATEAQKTYGAGSLQYQDATNKVAQAEAALQEQLAGKVPELTAAQKAQAAYSLIMADTSLAQGDYARTADGAANSQRTLMARFANMRAELGQKLLPIGQKLINFLSTLIDKFTALPDGVQTGILVFAGFSAALGPVLGGLGSAIKLFTQLPALINGVNVALQFLAANPWIIAIAAIAVLGYLIYKNWDTLGPMFADLGKAIGNAAKAIGKWVVDYIWHPLQAAWNWVSENWDILLTILTGPFGLAILVVRRWGDDIKRIVGGIASAITGAFRAAWQVAVDLTRSAVTSIGNVIGTIVSFPSRIAEGLRGVVTSVLGGVKAIINGFATAINTVIGFINGIQVDIPSWIPGIGGNTLGFPDIPKVPLMAQGGPLAAYQAAIVGDAGPELWVPNTAGRVVSNQDLASLLAGGDNRPNLTINVSNPINEPTSVSIAHVQKLAGYTLGAI